MRGRRSTAGGNPRSILAALSSANVSCRVRRSNEAGVHRHSVVSSGVHGGAVRLPLRRRHFEARDAEAVRRADGEDESLARGHVPLQAGRGDETRRPDGAQQPRRVVRGERRLRQRGEGVPRSAAPRPLERVHSEKLQPLRRVHAARKEAPAGDAEDRVDRYSAAGHDDDRDHGHNDDVTRAADAAHRHHQHRCPSAASGRLPMKRFALTLALLVPFTAFAGVMEVKLKLPVKPKLQITGDEKIAIAPFIIASKGEKKSDRAAKVDVQQEFNRYLRKQLTKSTKLRLADVGPTRLPGTDMKSLEAARDYWKEIGAKTGADFIVSGVVDFDI